MKQSWADLLFLHWPLDPGEVQRTLPPGLAVDVHEDRAWLGIVPFFMHSVRPAGFSAVPWLSRFMEMNVRTYVRDAAGRPGVWFYSLDCNRWPAVEIARKWFNLPYQHAAMKAEREDDGRTILYHCRRRGGAGRREAAFRYRAEGDVYTASKGSLEFFLTERYRLFAWNGKRRQLHCGEVLHRPYPLQSVEVSQWSAEPALWNGDFVLEGPPAVQHFSAGVDVEIFPLRQCGSGP